MNRYQLILERNTRYDGKFYFAVKTTGIFCRPSCPAPRPLEKNVVFYATAQEALRGGFRACKRCHPLRPLADRKAKIIRAITVESEAAIQSAAFALDVTDRQLRRIVAKDFGMSPLYIVQTKRVAVAKDLLVQTRMNIVDIAFLAGFKSLRQCNDVFKRLTGLTPSAFRKSHASAESFHILASDSEEAS